MKRCLQAALLAVLAFGERGRAEVFSRERLAAAREVMAGIYNLDYEAAEQMCRAMIRTDADDPFPYALLARKIWAEQLHASQGLTIDRFSGSPFYRGAAEQKIGVSPEDERRFQAAFREAVERANRRLARNPEDAGAKFALGIAHQTRASYEFTMRRNWWAAFRDGERALRLHRAVLQKAPDFVDAKLAKAVSEYAVASVPWSVRWVPFLLGYKGSKITGKAELAAVADHGIVLGDDARTILVLFHSLDNEYDAAVAHLERLGRSHPRNYLIPLELAAIALRRYQPQKAVADYQALLRRVEAREPGYERLSRGTVFLRLGVASREAGDGAAALNWLERALQTATEPLSTIAHLELGKTLDLRGERAQALERYRAVLSAADVLGSRQEARTWMSRPYAVRK